MSRILNVEEAHAVAILSDAADRLYNINAHGTLDLVRARINDMLVDHSPAEEIKASGEVDPAEVKKQKFKEFTDTVDNLKTNNCLSALLVQLTMDTETTIGQLQYVYRKLGYSGAAVVGL